jgi:hypothetical protein
VTIVTTKFRFAYTGVLLLSCAFTAPAADLEISPTPGASVALTGTADAARSGSPEIAELRRMLLDQQLQIEELRRELSLQKEALSTIPSDLRTNQPARLTTVAAIGGAGLVTGGTVDAVILPALSQSRLSSSAAAAQQADQPPAFVKDLTNRIDTVERQARGLGGFLFSGDFRYRFDLQARSGNEVAGPLQNARSRYRARMNVDKALSSTFRFHVQLSTGPVATETTNDEDFAGLGVKAPFSLAEAWASYVPNSHFAFRFGRMEETFADNSRFLWDDDIRFNGFEEVARTSIRGKNSIFNTVEVRAGQYILTNPNVAIAGSTSPFVAAGYSAGTRIGAANLFHPGVVLRGSLSENWSHQLTADMQFYRNANQIQLASTANGFPVLTSNTVGVALSAPIGATGNATTSAGGAVYNAANFRIARLAYRMDSKSLLSVAGKAIPGYLDFQVSRNIGASKLRDAMMVTASLGAVRKLGDVRGLYQFAIKDANSLISQFTDDDLGTGTGVNIAVHGLRFDVGLTRYLQWQNLLFIQQEKSVSSPQELFFVPLQRGAGTTFRYLGQLAFTF